MAGGYGAFTGLRRRKKENLKQKSDAFKKSLRHNLPEVFVKSILQSPLVEEDRTVLSPISLVLSDVDEEDKVCTECRKIIDDGENHQNTLSEMQLSGLSDDTVLVSHQLKTLKEQRRKFEEQQKLNEVLERVQAALDYSGIKFDDELVELPNFQDNLFDIEGNKKKRKERSFIYDMFEESAKLGRGRDEVMQDVENWFSISCDDLSSFCSMKLSDTGEDEDIYSDDYFVRIHKAFRRSNDSIDKLLSAIQRSMGGGTGVGKSTGRESRRRAKASKHCLPVLNTEHNQSAVEVAEKVGDPEVVSSEESVAEHKIRINKKIYTEQELNSWKGVQGVMKMLNTLTNDGIKNATSAQAKNCYKIGNKQLKILAAVIERKLELVVEQEERVKTLTSEVTTLKCDQQLRTNDKKQVRMLADENEQLREELSGLQQYLQDLDTKKNHQLQYDTAQRATSRHVSIKLPDESGTTNEESVASMADGDGAGGGELEITVNHEGGTISNISVVELRDNLKKKLSSRRLLQQRNSARLSTRNTALSNQSMLSSQPSIGGITVPPRGQSDSTPSPSSTNPMSAAKVSKPELYEYDSESVSSHEQFESVIKKSEHYQTDQLRQQIHMLREEVRLSDDRYYEQREELENLRQIVASQSTNKSETDFKGKEKSYEKTIEKFQVQQKLLKKELSDKKHDLTAKQTEIKGLQQRLQLILRQMESTTSNGCGSGDAVLDLDKPSEPPELHMPTIDIATIPRNQLIAKITRQSDQELNRLRKFIVREQQRFQANMRRNNLEANKALTKLRNEHNQLLRGISHFKDTVEKLLHTEATTNEGESDFMNDSVSSMSLISSNVTVGESSMDVLVTLERRLYSILMQKRLIVKHSNATKTNTDKELEKTRLQLQKRTVECTDQQQQAKRVEVRNELLSRQCQQLSYLNHGLQRELQPCKELMKKYAYMQEQVDRLKASEREQERDSKQLTKELEADRSRLKKEVNQLTMAQICPLKKNTPNNLWSRLNCTQKKEVIDKAFSLSQITSEHHHVGGEILTYCNDIALEQFADLVVRYMDLCKFRRINETVRSLSRRHNSDSQTRFTKYMEQTARRYQQSKAVWRERCQAMKEERAKAFLLLGRLFGESVDGFVVPSIQLSQPTYPRPPENTAQQDEQRNPNLHNGPRKLGDIVGKRITEKTNKQSYWQMPPDVSFDNPVQITVPNILAMDVGKCQQSTFNKRAKMCKAFLPPIATLFP